MRYTKLLASLFIIFTVTQALMLLWMSSLRDELDTFSPLHRQVMILSESVAKNTRQMSFLSEQIALIQGSIDYRAPVLIGHWITADGEPHKVRTPRHFGEGFSTWLKRHKETAKELKKQRRVK